MLPKGGGTRRNGKPRRGGQRGFGSASEDRGSWPPSHFGNNRRGILFQNIFWNSVTVPTLSVASRWESLWVLMGMREALVPSTGAFPASGRCYLPRARSTSSGLSSFLDCALHLGFRLARLLGLLPRDVFLAGRVRSRACITRLKLIRLLASAS
jgi:hypothetical protein